MVKKSNSTHRGTLVLIADNDPPSGVPKGQTFLDDKREIITWNDGDGYEFPTYVQDVKTSATTVSNTTTETEVFRADVEDTGLVKGRVFILRVFGKYSTASSDDNFDFKVKVGDSGFDAQTGGTTIAQIPTTKENVTDGPFQSKTTMTITSEGQSGVMKAHTEARFNGTPKDNNTGDTTINTDKGEEFVATAEWESAKSANSVTIDQSYLQQQA